MHAITDTSGGSVGDMYKTAPTRMTSRTMSSSRPHAAGRGLRASAPSPRGCTAWPSTIAATTCGGAVFTRTHAKRAASAPAPGSGPSTSPGPLRPPAPRPPPRRCSRPCADCTRAPNVTSCTSALTGGFRSRESPASRGGRAPSSVDGWDGSWHRPPACFTRRKKKSRILAEAGFRAESDPDRLRLLPVDRIAQRPHFRVARDLAGFQHPFGTHAFHFRHEIAGTVVEGEVAVHGVTPVTIERGMLEEADLLHGIGHAHQALGCLDHALGFIPPGGENH